MSVRVPRACSSRVFLACSSRVLRVFSAFLAFLTPFLALFRCAGLLGNLTSVVMVYLGVQAGRILVYYESAKHRFAHWLSWAVALGALMMRLLCSVLLCCAVLRCSALRNHASLAHRCASNENRCDCAGPVRRQQERRLDASEQEPLVAVFRLHHCLLRCCCRGSLRLG